MRLKQLFILASCFSAAALQAQSMSPSLQSVANYRQWGWNAIVMQNDYITVATVPAIGGRVMQCDLGSNPSVFVNNAELGKTYAPTQNSPWHNFGGYKTWPAPQSRWNAGGWPPPPTLDFGAYTVLDTLRTNDSVAVQMSSPVETWFAPGIQLVRTATVYRGSTRVKMQETIINQGTQAVNWSVWGVTQAIVNHPGKTDYSNYWVYFPINPNSGYGQTGVSTQGNSAAWKGAVAPGVYGVQFVPDNQKIFADPARGWIAYTSMTDTIVFARTFEVFEGAQYPDNGCRVAVYVSAANPSYFEVETTSPTVSLDAGGGSYSFTENWWACRVRAPILVVNDLGATAKKLAYNSATQMLSGIYGVFDDGTLNVVFVDATGQVLAQGQQHTVSPISEVQLNETVAIPAGAKTVSVQIRNSKGDLIGVLDSADVTQLLTSVGTKTPTFPFQNRLAGNFPNPFNPTTSIEYSIAEMSVVQLKIIDLLGREVATLVNEVRHRGMYNVTWNALNLPSGVYFCQLRAGTFVDTKKLLLLK